MLKKLCLVVLLSLLPVVAQAQNVFTQGSPPFSGTALGAGQSVASPLFAASSAAMRAAAPFSYSYWINGWTNSQVASANAFITNFQAGPTGFSSQYNPTATLDTFRFQQSIQPSSNNNGGGCNAGGRLCQPVQVINDQNLHHICVSWNATNGNFYIDGIWRPPSNSLGTFTANSHYWSVGTAMPSTTKMIDIGYWNRALTAAECSLINNRGRAGYNLASGSLLSGLRAHWTLSDCTGAGASLSCPDTSGVNTNPLIPDAAAPTLAISTPSAGTVSGSVSMTGTCTDAIGCTTVNWLVDGVPVGSSTTSPYTTAWDSTKWPDGSHVISMLANNAGGIVGTPATVTVTSSNSITAKTVYVSTGGTNAGSVCTSSSTPCQTLAYVLNPSNGYAPFHGGDTIALKAGDNFSCAAGECLGLYGPGNFFGGTVNAYGAGSAAPITVTTWNGGTCTPIAGTVTGCATLTLAGAIATDTCVVEVSNVNNVTLQNLVVIGTGQATAQVFPAAGICNVPQGATHSVGFTATNNRVVDMYYGITVDGNYAFLSGGSPDNFTVTNNDVHGSTTTAVVEVGIHTNGTANQFGSSVVSGNLVYNIGTDTAAPAQAGGVFMTNHFGNTSPYTFTDQFNVVHETGNNWAGSNCGSSVANWHDAVVGVIVQFNESYNTGLTVTTGCDLGGFDFDGGVSQSFLQYNYGHANRGYAFGNIPAALSSTFPWGTNQERYNIAENNWAGCTDQQCSHGFGVGNGAAATAWSQYNNTLYSVKNNTTPPWGGSAVNFSGWIMGFDICQPTATTVANNIMAMNVSSSTSARFVSIQNTTACSGTTAGPTFKNNAYFLTSGSNSQWVGPASTTTSTLLAAWQGVILGGDTGATQANPNWLSAGTGGTCWNGTSIPTGPQPCPSGYALTAGSTGYIGTGFDTTSLGTNTRDYYGTTVPNITGSGFNLGADGATH